MDIRHFDKGFSAGRTKDGSARHHINVTNYTGKGIENQLVNAVVFHNRKEHAKSLTFCTFTRSVFPRDYQLVID